MKRYIDFKVFCKDNQLPNDLLNLIQAKISQHYKHERYNTLEINDTLAVYTNYENSPSARIILVATTEPKNCVAIVNIVPTGDNRIEMNEYNMILRKFRDETINPIISSEGNTIYENAENYGITDIIPKSYIELNRWLNNFPLTRHPSDEERWYDFLIALIDNDEQISSEDLEKYIKEKYRWEDKDIDDLTERYSDQIGLLRYYVEHERNR